MKTVKKPVNVKNQTTLDASEDKIESKDYKIKYASSKIDDDDQNPVVNEYI